MQRPKPGELWRFTKHSSISRHLVTPGTLLLVLESDETAIEDHPNVFRLRALIDNKVFDFYAPASYMESCRDEINGLSEKR